LPERARCALRALKIALDDHHQVVEVMRDAATELSDGLHALGHGKLLLCLAQDALCFHPLGDVSRHLGKANELARFIADRIDDHGGPEARSVLAHAPALGVEPSLPRRRGERDRRAVRRTVLLGIEAAEMLPDDLGVLVALDALGARVPGRDDAIGIELEDRIVDDGLDQMAEAAFALEQLLLFETPLRHVAGDLGEPDQPAVGVADGVDDGQRPESRAIAAHAPALAFEPAPLGRCRKRVLRELARLVFRREKAGEWLSDDLLGAIAFQPLCAGIPADDAAFEVDHVDGIIDDGVDQQLQPPGIVADGLALFLGRHSMSWVGDEVWGGIP
jgi:hypothetical protein